MLAKPYPWHFENWHTVHLANRSGKMTHAILCTGSVGIGLKHFSKCLASSLLCKDTLDDNIACGVCRSCHLIHGKSHPDLFFIEPEAVGKQIKVDAIRQLIDAIHLHSQYGRYKIGIITPAEAMNQNAANSLLKTLEEPPDNSLLILLSHRPNLLAITLRSRCQQMKFNPTFSQATIDWVNKNLESDKNAEVLLQMAGGAPLAIAMMLASNVMEYQQNILQDLFTLRGKQADPVKVAERWKSYETSQVLLWLLQLLTDMVRIKSSVSPIKINDTMTINRLQELIKRLDLRELADFYQLLLDKYSMSTATISYNAQGLLEDVIISWQQLHNKVNSGINI